MDMSLQLAYKDRRQQAEFSPAPSQPDLSSLACKFTEFKSFMWQAVSNLKQQIEMFSCWAGPA